MRWQIDTSIIAQDNIDVINTELEHIISNKRPGVVYDINFENSCTTCSSKEADGINVTISAQNTTANTAEKLISIFSHKAYFLVQWIESDNSMAIIRHPVQTVIIAANNSSNVLSLYITT